MTTRTVTGTVLDPDLTGTTPIVFNLKYDFTATDGTVYLHGLYSVTPDSSAGTFSISLPVPDTGAATYEITLPGNSPVTISLESGTSIDLSALLLISEIGTSPSALQTLIDAEQTATIVNKTATYIILATDEVIRCNGTFTVTLPEATGSGRAYAVKNTGTGVITIACNGADEMDGETTYTLYTQNTAAFLDAADGVWDLY
jgi:hypothetical protein